MSPSHLIYPGPDWSHGSPSESQDSQSSPNALPTRHELASPRKEPQQPDPDGKKRQKAEPSGDDLDHNHLRSQNSRFIEPGLCESRLPLTFCPESPGLVGGGFSRTTKQGIPHPSRSLETKPHGDSQPEFQALISRPDNIQSVENIRAEGFNFSANNLRQNGGIKAKVHRQDKRTRQNTSLSQPAHPSNDHANPSVVSHRSVQNEGSKTKTSGLEDHRLPFEAKVARIDDKKVGLPAGSPRESSLSPPNQHTFAPNQGDPTGFSSLPIPNPAHPIAGNNLADQHESRQADFEKSPYETNTQPDDGQVETKGGRLEAAQSSKVTARPACQIKHCGPHGTPEDPTEVPVQTNRHRHQYTAQGCMSSHAHDGHNMPGSLSKSLSHEHSGTDRVLPQVPLFQIGSYQPPSTNPSGSITTKQSDVLQRETPNTMTAAPFPSTQHPPAMDEQRMSGSINAQNQSQAPLRDNPAPDTELGQAAASRSHSREVNSPKDIPDVISDLTFTHSAHDAGTHSKRSTAARTECAIDEEGRGTRRDFAQRQLEHGHSSQAHRKKQHAKRGRGSNIATQSRKPMATVPGLGHPIPRNIREETCDCDHHSHSSPSNISKPRDHPYKIVGQRKKSKSPVPQALATGLNSIAEEWNSFFTNFVGYEEHMASKLSDLKQHIATQDRRIAGFQHNLAGKEQEIAGLKDKIEAQAAQLSDVKAEKEAANAQAENVKRQLAISNSKTEALREKCHHMKSRFNEGLAEQQKLYTKNKEHCDKVLDAARKETQAREQSVRDASRACDQTRLDFQKRLEAVKEEANMHTALLEKETSTLQSQLEAQKRELAREKENTERSEKKLNEAHQMNAGIIQTLASQNAKILQMMEAQQTQAEAACLSNDEQNLKLEQISKTLREVESGVSNPSNLFEKMKNHDEDLMAALVATIERMMPINVTDKEKWAMQIDFIHGTCDNIWNQIRDDILAEETHRRFYDAQSHLGNAAEKLVRLESELENAVRYSSENVEENNRLSLEAENLRGQVENLQATVSTLQNASREADQISNEQAEMLETRLTTVQQQIDKEKQASDQEIQKLKKTVQEKEKTIGFAEEKRKIAEEQLNALRATFRQKEIQLKNDYRALEERLEEAKRSHEDSMEKELEESEEAQAELESSLAEARAKIRRMSSDRQTTDTEFQNLRKLVGDGTQTANDLKAEVQNSQRTQTFLKECLVEWTRDRIKLEGLKAWQAKATDNAEGETEANRLRPSSSKRTETEPLNARELDRSVTLRSPQEDDPKASPLSVMQEKDVRRQVDPPKSIMRVTRQASKRLEAAKQAEAAETLHVSINVDVGKAASNDEMPMQNQFGSEAPPRRRAVTTYSSYNRPVEGNASSISSAQESGKKRSVAQYAQATGLEGVVFGRSEAKRPKIGGKTPRSASKHSPQTDDARMAEVDSETAEENDQTRTAPDDVVNRQTPSVPSTQSHHSRQRPGRISDMTFTSGQKSDKGQMGYDASENQDQAGSQASAQTTKTSSQDPIPTTKTNS